MEAHFHLKILQLNFLFLLEIGRNKNDCSRKSTFEFVVNLEEMLFEELYQL